MPIVSYTKEIKTRGQDDCVDLTEAIQEAVGPTTCLPRLRRG